jgi:hypothetical protein
MPDRRDPDHIQHKMVEMVTARVTADEHDNIDYIFGLAGNAALDVLVAGIADNLRFHHAKSVAGSHGLLLFE